MFSVKNSKFKEHQTSTLTFIFSNYCKCLYVLLNFVFIFKKCEYLGLIKFPLLHILGSLDKDTMKKFC